MAKARAKKSKGLSVKTFAGLNEKRMKSRGGGASNRIIIKDNDTVTIQFPYPPDPEKPGFREFEQHSFQEDGNWQYVPCAGDECPLCQDESSAKSKKSYQFVAIAYDFKERKVKILKGPKTLATQIFFRYQKKRNLFTKRAYDITRFPTNPTSYNFELSEESPVNTKALKSDIDLDKYLDGELTRYFGDDFDPLADSSLDDDDDDLFLDDDEDDEDDLDDEGEWTKEELLELDDDELKEAAKDSGVKIKGKKKSQVIKAILRSQE